MRKLLALSFFALLFIAGCGGSMTGNTIPTDNTYHIANNSSGVYALMNGQKSYSLTAVGGLIDTGGTINLVAPGGLTATLTHQDANVPRGINITRGGGNIQDIILTISSTAIRISNFDDSNRGLPLPSNGISRGGDPNVYVYTGTVESTIPRNQFEGRLSELIWVAHVVQDHQADLDPISAVTAAEVNHEIGL